MSDIVLDQADRLLSTTKQVRKRLDLDRPVPLDLLLECIDISNHAPVGGNIERNQWMIVRDPQRKEKIAEYYAAVGRPYLDASGDRAEGKVAQVKDSARYLVDHLAEVPAIVIPLTEGRPPEEHISQAGFWGSVLPAVWSFQLAARARGLGSCWTTFHLAHEAAVAELLGIPDTMTQAALLPVAYYTGDSFTPAKRRPAASITHLDTWGSHPGDA